MRELDSLITYALIETVRQPSEIANLEAEDIVLDRAVSDTRIQPKAARVIRTRRSVRRIPLVSVSIEALRCAPTGFERYRDNRLT